MNDDERASPSPELPARRADLDPLVSAAWLYYQENYTQAEIARVLGISRPSVSNLLTRARDEGVVSIAVHPQVLQRVALATEVRERFGLHDALVVPIPDEVLTGGDIARSLGRAGATYLETVLRPGDVLGTCWGKGMDEVAKALTPSPVEGVVVAQSLGGLLLSTPVNPARVAWLMAEKLDARVYHLHVPQYVGSARIKELFLQDETISSAFKVARSASLMILGVGGVGDDATAVQTGVLDSGAMAELRARGAVGDLSGRYFDLLGRPVPGPTEDRLMALTLEDIRRIRPVIAVAGGPPKTAAILGALRTGCIDVLITDGYVAERLLQLDRTA